MFLIIFPLAPIHRPIFISKFSFPIPFVLTEISTIFCTVSKVYLAHALAQTLPPRSLIYVLIRPGILSFAMFDPHEKFARICCAIWPRQNAYPIPLVILPSSLVRWSVRVVHFSMPMLFVAQKTARVVGSKLPDKSTLSVQHSISELARVFIPIWPSYFAATLYGIFNKFALHLRPIHEGYRPGTLFQIVIESTLIYCTTFPIESARALPNICKPFAIVNTATLVVMLFVFESRLLILKF